MARISLQHLWSSSGSILWSGRSTRSPLFWESRTHFLSKECTCWIWSNMKAINMIGVLQSSKIVRASAAKSWLTTQHRRGILWLKPLITARRPLRQIILSYSLLRKSLSRSRNTKKEILTFVRLTATWVKSWWIKQEPKNRKPNKQKSVSRNSYYSLKTKNPCPNPFSHTYPQSRWWQTTSSSSLVFQSQCFSKPTLKAAMWNCALEILKESATNS